MEAVIALLVSMLTFSPLRVWKVSPKCPENLWNFIFTLNYVTQILRHSTSIFIPDVAVFVAWIYPHIRRYANCCDPTSSHMSSIVWLIADLGDNKGRLHCSHGSPMIHCFNNVGWSKQHVRSNKNTTRISIFFLSHTHIETIQVSVHSDDVATTVFVLRD